MKKLSYVFYLVLCFILIGCNNETKHDYKTKVVIAKTVKGEDYLVAFNDGTQVYLSFAGYSIINNKDSVTFKCIEGMYFSHWNCSIVKVNGKKY